MSFNVGKFSYIFQYELEISQLNLVSCPSSQLHLQQRPILSQNKAILAKRLVCVSWMWQLLWKGKPGHQKKQVMEETTLHAWYVLSRCRYRILYNYAKNFEPEEVYAFYVVSYDAL